MMAKLKQMAYEAAVIAMALAMFTAILFFGSGVWEAAKPEIPPWSKPSTLETEEYLYFAPWQAETASGRVTTSGHGYFQRKKQRGR